MNEGRHSLSIRARRPNTSAVFAPELHAYLCDEHVTSGMDVEIRLKARADGEVRTRVVAISALAVTRSTPIRNQP